ADIPAVRFPADRDRLGCALKRAGPAHRKTANLRQNQEALIRASAAVLTHLRVGEAVVALASVEARVARCLASLDAAEEGLEGPIYALHHVLQDLAVDRAVLRHLGFDGRKLGLLLVVADRDAALVPGFAALTNGSVVDLATEHQSTVKRPLLFGSGLELV